MHERLSPSQRREVASIAQEKARTTVNRLLARSENESSTETVNRRTALKITGVGGLLGLTALGSGPGVDTVAARNHEEEDEDEDEEEEEEEDEEVGAGLKNLMSGQWNLRQPQHWVVRPPAPPKGVGGPSVVHDGVIYCFGGRLVGETVEEERQISAFIIRHRGAKNTWVTDSATPPAHLGDGAATTVDGSAYVLTGEGFFKYSFPSDPVDDSGSWTPLADSANGDSVLSYDVGLAAVDSDVYRIGGVSDPQAVYRFNGSDWTQLNPDGDWPGQTNPTAVTYNGEIYAIGGENIPSTSVAVFDPNTAKWDDSGVSDMPLGASSHSVTVRGDKLYVLGGTAITTQVYDFTTDEWEVYPGPHEDPASNPATGTNAGAGPWNGIYIFGGGDGAQMFRADVFGPVD